MAPVKLDATPRLKGLNFTRAAIALAVAGGDRAEATHYAAQRWGVTSAAVDVLEKAAVAAMTSGGWTDDGSFSAAAEFYDAVAERSLLGVLPLRRVPFDVKCISVAEGTQAFWTAQGKAVPISRAALDFAALAALKVAAMTVVNREAIAATGGLAEQALRTDLLRACAAALDQAFIDPANAGVAGAKPASVTNGAQTATAGDPDTIIGNLLDAFAGDAGAAWLVLHPAHAARLSGPGRPDVGARGGSWAGIPVATSRGMPSTAVVMLDPTGIAFAGGGGEIKASTEATVEMSDTPAGSTVPPVATTQVSLFGTGAAALGASVFANWTAIREGAVVIGNFTP